MKQGRETEGTATDKLLSSALSKASLGSASPASASLYARPSKLVYTSLDHVSILLKLLSIFNANLVKQRPPSFLLDVGWHALRPSFLFFYFFYLISSFCAYSWKHSIPQEAVTASITLQNIGSKLIRIELGETPSRVRLLHMLLQFHRFRKEFVFPSAFPLCISNFFWTNYLLEWIVSFEFLRFCSWILSVFNQPNCFQNRVPTYHARV